MGKTAWVHQLEQAFFGGSETETLATAYRRHGFVPLVIAMRNYPAIDPDSGEPEHWLPEIARLVLAADGFPVNDRALLRGMLANGGFALVLDGVNEIGHGAELDLYAQQATNVRPLVTSQGVPDYAPKVFAVWRLPQTITEAVAPLLKLYLGEERGHAVFAHIEQAPLRNDILSGYDVRLLADLVGSTGDLSAIPADRIGLYERILASLALPDRSAYPVADLCNAAWILWREGRRYFSLEGDAAIAPDLLPPLLREDRKVIRALGGSALSSAMTRCAATWLPDGSLSTRSHRLRCSSSKRRSGASRATSRRWVGGFRRPGRQRSRCAHLAVGQRGDRARRVAARVVQTRAARGVDAPEMSSRLCVHRLLLKHLARLERLDGTACAAHDRRGP